jgi:hypothetical protein
MRVLSGMTANPVGVSYQSADAAGCNHLRPLQMGVLRHNRERSEVADMDRSLSLRPCRYREEAPGPQRSPLHLASGVGRKNSHRHCLTLLMGNLVRYAGCGWPVLQSVSLLIAACFKSKSSLVALNLSVRPSETSQHYPEHLRRIRLKDPEADKTLRCPQARWSGHMRSRAAAHPCLI